MTWYYAEKLKTLIKWGMLGAIGGVLLGYGMGDIEGFDLRGITMFIMVFVGFPYGVVKVWNFMGGIIPLNLYTLAMYLFAIFLGSAVVGILVYPLVLIYTIIKYFYYRNKEGGF